MVHLVYPVAENEDAYLSCSVFKTIIFLLVN